MRDKELVGKEIMEILKHRINWDKAGQNLGGYRTAYECVECQEELITDGHRGIGTGDATDAHQTSLFLALIETVNGETEALDDEERTELARLRVVVGEVEAITADLKAKSVNPWVVTTGYAERLEKALGLGKFKLPVEGGAKFMATLRGDEDSHHQFVTLTGGGEVFYRKLDPSKLSFYTEERLRYFYEDFREVGE